MLVICLQFVCTFIYCCSRFDHNLICIWIVTGKGYDPTMRGRLSSDTTWDKNEKGGLENWRSGVQHDAEDDGGGWRVSGHRYADKTDRWRGGSY